MIDEITSLILFNVVFIISILISFFSISKRANYIAILMTTILWGIIPWPYYYLKDQLNSMLMITFLRVFISTIFSFLTIFILMYINRIKTRKGKFTWYQYSFQDFKKNITGYVPLLEIQTKSGKKYRLSYLAYYFLLGICYFFSILFYFLSYQFIGVIFSSIMNTIIVTIIVAIYNLLRKLENLDIVKISYLSILTIAGIMTIMGSPIIFSSGTAIFGLLSLTLTLIFWFLFLIISGFDDFTKYEKLRIISFKERNTNYQLVKSLTKVSFFFLFSLIVLILFIIIYPLIPYSNDILINEIRAFINELKYLPVIFQNSWTWTIGIECTIIPYIIYFQSQNNWPGRSLRWDQWVAILAIFEPITSIFVGLFIGNETNYDLILIFISIGLMVIVMILRYYHEKNCIKAVIFLKIKQDLLIELINKLKYNPYIFEIKTITGEYDLMVRTFHQSFYKLKKFLDKLKGLKSVQEIMSHIEIEEKKKG
ncbi:MAG: hypothetical protein ACTSPY_09390 [Candidatus Helarchaeota archaeon]